MKNNYYLQFYISLISSKLQLDQIVLYKSKKSFEQNNIFDNLNIVSKSFYDNIGNLKMI